MKKYEEIFEIEDYMCDTQENLFLSYILKLAQTISAKQCAKSGILEKLIEKNLAFLLAKQGVRMTRHIKAHEIIKVSTLPKKARRGIFQRYNEICDENDNVIGIVDARWILVDVKTKRILRNLDEDLQIFHEEFQEMMDLSFPKFESEDFFKEVEVPYTYFDKYGHVNNTSYLDIISNATKGEIEMLSFNINYKRETKENSLVLNKMKTNNGTYFSGNIENEKRFEIFVYDK